MRREARKRGCIPDPHFTDEMPETGSGNKCPRRSAATAFSELVYFSSRLYWSFFLLVFYYEKCQTYSTVESFAVKTKIPPPRVCIVLYLLYHVSPPTNPYYPFDTFQSEMKTLVCFFIGGC